MFQILTEMHWFQPQSRPKYFVQQIKEEVPARPDLVARFDIASGSIHQLLIELGNIHKSNFYSEVLQSTSHDVQL